MGKKSNTLIVVKFRDEIDLPYTDGVERYIQKDLETFNFKVETGIETLTLKKVFNSLPPDKIKGLTTKAKERNPNVPTPNLLSYFKLECPERVNPQKLVNHFSRLAIVQTAYIDTPETEPGTVNPSDDSLYINQRYLAASPEGIDAKYAWGFPGGDGAGQSVIDLERGWTLNHEDLLQQQVKLLYGNIRNESRWHGTAVLGELAAKDNEIGCIGIVPNLKSINVVSYYNVGVDNAILAAIPYLEPGNVLILEVQTNNLPIEVKPAVFDAIQLAIQNGIVVFEAAGNGGVNLDLYKIDGKNIFNRSSSDFRDSGAIMVGASTGIPPHKRISSSNYGSRIDCYSWGVHVVTAYSDSQGATKKYTHNFNRTSSATPIVAGAALAIQGIIEVSHGYRLSPSEIQNILADPTFGTASENPPIDRIGVMPNLRTIIDSLLQ
ncbi:MULTISPECIES: S8 family peptidase [Bacillus]|uniref:S8 family peptidase n=1 Tax=Bacillus TaxID=1386 RepID=UPI00159BCE30|nr:MULTISPECIES: S8 family peptidase [Bacillus]KAF6700430.1 S8 family serine peptidase [Bacillus sp. EKM501B]